jgi:nitrite reductase/ring-hydroxylating ferredoxin subunit
MGSINTPDFTKGFPVDDLQNGGMIQGKVGDEDVILSRHADEFFAVGAGCTHYHGPLAEGLLVGDELHCPLHHACFSLRKSKPCGNVFQVRLLRNASSCGPTREVLSPHTPCA